MIRNYLIILFTVYILPLTIGYTFTPPRLDLFFLGYVFMGILFFICTVIFLYTKSYGSLKKSIQEQGKFFVHLLVMVPVFIILFLSMGLLSMFIGFFITLLMFPIRNFIILFVTVESLIEIFSLLLMSWLYASFVMIVLEGSFEFNRSKFQNFKFVITSGTMLSIISAIIIDASLEQSGFFLWIKGFLIYSFSALPVSVMFYSKLNDEAFWPKPKKTRDKISII